MGRRRSDTRTVFRVTCIIDGLSVAALKVGVGIDRCGSLPMIRLDRFLRYFWRRFGIVLELLASLAGSRLFRSTFAKFQRKLSERLANDAVGCVCRATCIIGGLARFESRLANDAVEGLRYATCIIGGLARFNDRLANDAVGRVGYATCIIGGLVVVVGFP